MNWQSILRTDESNANSQEATFFNGGHEKGSAGPKLRAELIYLRTRREARAYPHTHSNGYVFNWPGRVTTSGRSDYAACAGSQTAGEAGGILGKGPSSYAEGDREMSWAARSETAIRNLTRGACNTLLVAEKYLNPDHYTTGQDKADNEFLFSGGDNDTLHTTARPPTRDARGVSDKNLFGSNHFGGLNAAYGDGSVRWVSWDVDRALWSESGRR